VESLVVDRIQLIDLLIVVHLAADDRRRLRARERRQRRLILGFRIERTQPFHLCGTKKTLGR
jgi:hypothetical protein